jgi:hypothetical protein
MSYLLGKHKAFEANFGQMEDCTLHRKDVRISILSSVAAIDAWTETLLMVVEGLVP